MRRLRRERKSHIPMGTMMLRTMPMDSGSSAVPPVEDNRTHPRRLILELPGPPVNSMGWICTPKMLARSEPTMTRPQQMKTLYAKARLTSSGPRPALRARHTEHLGATASAIDGECQGDTIPSDRAAACPRAAIRVEPSGLRMRRQRQPDWRIRRGSSNEGQPRCRTRSHRSL
jgi:hypothetical protein